MDVKAIHRFCGGATTALSIIALLCVASGYVQRPQRDEGTAAHIFQIAAAFEAVAVLFFIGTTDARRISAAVRLMIVPAVITIAAFVALALLEAH